MVYTPTLYQKQRSMGIHSFIVFCVMFFPVCKQAYYSVHSFPCVTVASVCFLSMPAVLYNFPTDIVRLSYDDLSVASFVWVFTPSDLRLRGLNIRITLENCDLPLGSDRKKGKGKRVLEPFQKPEGLQLQVNLESQWVHLLYALKPWIMTNLLHITPISLSPPLISISGGTITVSCWNANISDEGKSKHNQFSVWSPQCIHSLCSPQRGSDQNG